MFFSCCYQHDQCYADLEQNKICRLSPSHYVITYKYYGCSTCGNLILFFHIFCNNVLGKNKEALHLFTHERSETGNFENSQMRQQ